jgi:iron complex outermembrane receptor protein
MGRRRVGTGCDRRFPCAALAALTLAGAASAQRPDSTPVTLDPLTVSVVRGALSADSLPFSVTTVPAARIARARPTWGLDEALATVPGVFVANRYNFSLDQRISIRGFGSRSAFAVRGVKVLVDGVPQTLPDGQGQLTNLDLATVDRIEVIRGAASALYGNAAGGVISITTGVPAPGQWTQDLRVTAGGFAHDGGRAWHKWQAGTAFRVGAGAVRLSASRLAYEGQRDYSAADLRSLGGRLVLPLADAWTLTAAADVGDQPRAENPGALTRAELDANRDAAAAINVTQRAGKDVTQAQGALTLRRRLIGGGEVAVTGFGLARDLVNPQTFAWITIDRIAWGARAVLTRPVGPAGRHHISIGLDYQEQRDDRLNRANAGGEPDSVRLLDQRERVTEIGPFAQATVVLRPGIALTAGARWDAVQFRAADRLVTPTNPDDSGERTLSSASGSLGVTWTPARRLALYANAASSFETPTTTELTNSPSGAGGFNDALGPQRAVMLEAGARWGAGPMRASVAAFTADVRDGLIPFEVPAAAQRRFYRNAGRAQHRGLEAALDARPTPWLGVAASYTYADLRYRDYAVPAGGDTLVLDGRPLPGVPAHRVHLAVEIRPARGPWVELDVVGTGSVLVDDTLTIRAPGWSQVNLRTGLDAGIGGWRVRPFIAMQNALDRAYVGSVVINAAGGRYYEPAPGRNAYVGVALSGGR